MHSGTGDGIEGLNEHSTEVIEKLKGHEGALTQEMEITKRIKDVLAKQTEKAFMRQKRPSNQSWKDWQERERSLKTMRE